MGGETRSRRYWAYSRPTNLRERASSIYKWAEKHARVGFGPFKGKNGKEEENLRECGSNVHKWAEEHARVGF